MFIAQAAVQQELDGQKRFTHMMQCAVAKESGSALFHTRMLIQKYDKTVPFAVLGNRSCRCSRNAANIIICEDTRYTMSFVVPRSSELSAVETQ